jgi:hypothetical protein
MVGKTEPEPLELSPDDYHVLEQLRQGLHDEIIGSYEAYVNRARVVDLARWKAVRSEGDLHAFRERDDAPPEDRESMAIQPQAWMAARSQFPRVLVVGSVPGSLDDAMYTYAFHDSDSMRTNTLYEDSDNIECAVVNTLEGASDEDPFRIACVTWSLCTYPLFRDRVVLTYVDVRLARLKNGDRVGVMVTHSIRHDNFKEPKTSSRVVRVECSMASVFRQINGVSPDHVEVYTTHFVDPKGSAQDSIVLAEISNAFTVQETAKALLKIAKLTDTVLNKKLYFRMRQRLRQRLFRKRSGSLTIDAYGETPTQCEQCDKKLGGLFKSSGRACQLCDKVRQHDNRESLGRTTLIFSRWIVDLCRSCAVAVSPSASSLSTRRQCKSLLNSARRVSRRRSRCPPSTWPVPNCASEKKRSSTCCRTAKASSQAAPAVTAAHCRPMSGCARAPCPK